ERADRPSGQLSKRTAREVVLDPVAQPGPAAGERIQPRLDDRLDHALEKDLRILRVTELQHARLGVGPHAHEPNLRGVRAAGLEGAVRHAHDARDVTVPPGEVAGVRHHLPDQRRWCVDDGGGLHDAHPSTWRPRRLTASPYRWSIPPTKRAAGARSEGAPGP